MKFQYCLKLRTLIDKITKKSFFFFSVKMVPEGDSEGKVWIRMKVFKHCILGCYVSGPSHLIPDHLNEKITVHDNDGVGHDAIVNLCPENARTIDIAEFMDIFVKIKRLAHEENINDTAVVPNN